jgi:glycosyltransferase involved in cell wall biosynthesis
MTSDNKLHTICFGGEDWWYHNRGHVDMQLTRRLARLGTTLYVNSVVMQKPRILSDKAFVARVRRKLKSISSGVRPSGEGFWVYSPFSLPLHHMGVGRWLNRVVLDWQLSTVRRKLGIGDGLVIVHCPAACDVALRMGKSKLVYLRTDRYEEFPGVDAKAIAAYDARLKRNADLTIFANRLLCEAEAPDCRKAMYLDHGVDYERFAQADSQPGMPSGLEALPRPVVGFFGGIDNHTFDLRLVEQVVDRLPEMSFVFVGKSSVDTGPLAARGNVKMVGQVSYDTVPQYGKVFDVAIMPWRSNRWIEGCNPIKLKEYLALGKPVVSTPFPELENYRDVVYRASGPDEFARCIRRAIAEDSVELAAARRETVRQSSWEARAGQMLREVFGESAYSDMATECVKV